MSTAYFRLCLVCLASATEANPLTASICHQALHNWILARWLFGVLPETRQQFS
jgi:hypothetical protein